jgi:excisionase family DNA binding protein
MDDKTIKEWASGPLCTISQAARLLGVSGQTVRRMVLHGQLIAWRPNPAGRKMLLYRRQVEAMAVTLQRRAIHQARLLQSTFDFF